MTRTGGEAHEERIYCQVCGAPSSIEREYCARCSSKLLVISGPWSDEVQSTFDSRPEEQLSFDEHLLERISILEEVVRRTTNTVRQVLGTLYKLEQKFLVNQTGVTSLRDLLENKRLIGREEWSELWESRLDHQLLALEKRERFMAARNRIAALFRGQDRQRFLRLLDDAEVALLSFDIDGALRGLERALPLDPRNHELAFLLGETFFNEGDGPRALPYLERVLAERPDHYESLVLSGVLHHESGDVERAETLLRAAVEQHPQAFLPSFSLGAIFASQGRLDEAVGHLERAVAAEPVPRALYLLGSCLHELGRPTMAIRRLERAVALEPDFEDAWHLLGLAYLDRQWHKKALDALRRAQRLAPKKLAFADLVQLIPSQTARTSDARTARAASEERPGPARDEETRGRDGEATRWARRAAVAVGEGQWHQALSHYRRALGHSPDDPSLLVAYAIVCLELGRGTEIHSVIDKVIDLDPGERLKATAYTTLIEALRSEGKYHEGNRVGRLLLAEGRSAWSRTLACYEMACNLTELGEDLDEALGYARRALETSPDELRRLPLAALGWVHYQRREFAQAVECLTRSSELGPSARTLTHLGLALLATGERDEARDVLARARRLGSRGTFADEVFECLKDSARALREPREPRM